LNLSGSNIREAAFCELLGLAGQLKNLNISFCTFSLDCLPPRRNKLSKIESLTMKGCPALNDKILPQILKILPRVKYLDLSDTSIKATGVDFKKSALKLPQLEHLTLDNCTKLTEQGLANLLEISKGSLQIVTVTISDKLTAKLLAGLKSVFPHIQTVKIGHKDNTNICGISQTSKNAVSESNMIQHQQNLVAKHGESSFGADSFSNNFEIALAPESASEQVIAANTYPTRNESSHVIGMRPL